MLKTYDRLDKHFKSSGIKTHKPLRVFHPEVKMPKNKISREKYLDIVYHREVLGWTLQKTGARHNLTRERIRQLTMNQPDDSTLPKMGIVLSLLRSI